MKTLRIIAASLCALLVLCQAGHAETTTPTAGAAVNRHILAVYDGAEAPEGHLNRVYRFAAMPLEHLGYVVSYLDASKDLPNETEMQKYHGVVTWLVDNQLKNAANYGRWLTTQIKNGKKLVVIGDFGFYYNENKVPTPEQVWKELYEAFGLKVISGKTLHSALMIELASNDPAMTEFERKLGNDLPFFADLTAPDAHVYLKLKRKDTGSFFDAVFINDKGGAALGPYALYYNPSNKQTRWRLNPFLFFAKVFNSDFPKPDVSTMNGMRLFYSQVDGDGLRNESKIVKDASCATIMYDKIFLTYKLPITASVIIGDILVSRGKKRKQLIETLRKMYALPNIEAASHGWSHPSEWKEHTPMVDPRGFTYSPENEIDKSIAYINEHFAPKDKQTKTFFWTGDCQPDYEALKYVHDHDLKNINGGNTRFDNMFPSYTYVAPLFRMVNGLTQVLASNATEHSYTNKWQGPFYGYKHVVQTFERTETPMRIRPIDVYYNYYSMEYEPSKVALGDAYAYALKHEIFPVFTSTYIDIAHGFRTTMIDRGSDDRWIITNNGALRTMRFDNEGRVVDLDASSGVGGFTHTNGSLYVYLTNGTSSEIVLTSTRPTRQYIAKANGTIANWRIRGKAVDFTLRTIGRVHFTLGGLASAQTYIVTVRDKQYKVKSNGAGFLTFYVELPSRAFEDVKIAVE